MLSQVPTSLMLVKVSRLKVGTRAWLVTKVFVTLWKGVGKEEQNWGEMRERSTVGLRQSGVTRVH